MWRQFKGIAKVAGILILILSSFLFILKFVKFIPYLFIEAESFLILIFIITKKKLSPFFRLLALNLASIILILGIFEAYFAKDVISAFINNRGITDTIFEGDYSRPGYYYIINDKLRGYCAKNNIKVTSKLIKNGKVIYDVVYTINQYGLRVTPHDLKPITFNPDFKNIIFFGCSFMFGEGVNDSESLPFIFEEESQGKFKAYNFAFHGYGSHQMLRILETGFIDNIVTDRKPSIAIYQAFTGHVERSAFKYPYVTWDIKGPRYRLNKYGRDVIFVESNRTDLYLSSKIFCQLNKSFLFKRILKRFYYKLRTHYDIKLFVQIIKKSKEIFENKYKGEFYMVYWDIDEPDTQEIILRLKNEGIKIFTVSQIFGENNILEQKYFRKLIIKGDGHPYKLTHKRIARYLLDNMEVN